MINWFVFLNSGFFLWLDAMAGLFDDEPDEESPQHLFESEPNEQGKLFMDELDEAVKPLPKKKPSMTGAVIFQQEPDEVQLQPRSELFGEEPDESDSTPDSDVEEAYSGHEDDIEDSTKSLVELSFSTVSQFLATQLIKTSTKSDQLPRKKRCYNNLKREAAARVRKEQTAPAPPKEKRNCPAPCSYQHNALHTVLQHKFKGCFSLFVYLHPGKQCTFPEKE